MLCSELEYQPRLAARSPPRPRRGALDLDLVPNRPGDPVAETTQIQEIREIHEVWALTR